MNDEEKEEIIISVMEIMYEVFREAEDRIKNERHRSPLTAGASTPKILTSTLQSVFSEMYPDAHERLVKRIAEAKGISIDDDEMDTEEEEQ